MHQEKLELLHVVHQERVEPTRQAVAGALIRSCTQRVMHHETRRGAYGRWSGLLHNVEGVCFPTNAPLLHLRATILLPKSKHQGSGTLDAAMASFNFSTVHQFIHPSYSTISIGMPSRKGQSTCFSRLGSHSGVNTPVIIHLGH